MPTLYATRRRHLLSTLGAAAFALVLLAAQGHSAAAAAMYDPPERAIEVEVPAVDGITAATDAVAAEPPGPSSPQPLVPPLRGSKLTAEDEDGVVDGGDKSMRMQGGHKGGHSRLPHPTKEQLQQIQQLAQGLRDTPPAVRTFRADRLLSCAWSPVLDPGKDKPFLPDLNIQYNMQGFVFASNAPRQREARARAHPHAAHAAQAAQAVHHKISHTEPAPAPTPLPPDQEEVYRIRARYPYVRYFSFTTYDMRLQTVATLHDTQIKPASGKNPFSDPTTEEGECGTYEIYITKDGKRGYPNEMAALRPNATGVYGLMSFRLQLADPRPGLDRSGKNREWGFVEMPVVEIRNPRSGQFEPVRRCTEQMQAREEDFIEHLDVSFSKWWPRQLTLGSDCNATQFSLFDAERNPVIRRAVAVRNDEENYIFWCMPKEVLADKQSVVKIRGLLPRTPYGLYDAPRIPETWKYDARYVSFTSADAAPLYPSYQTLHDTAIRAHYTASPTGKGWDRRYTIIAAVDPDMAQRCGLYNPEQDLLLKFTRPPLPSPPHNPAIVMRELLPSGGTVRSGGAVADEQTVEREGVASVSLRNECVGPDGKLVCDPTTAARSQLREWYPTVEVYSCQQGKGKGKGKHHHGLHGRHETGEEGPLTPVRIY